MARIRTIKPEFWTDAKIADLSPDCALFFIGLWTIADDYGYFPSLSREVALRLPRWRSQSVQHMLRALQGSGLVRLSHHLSVGLIVGWKHQKIDKRQPSKWIDKEIVWDEVKPNAKSLRKKAPVEERRGEERKGEELSGGVQSGESAELRSAHDGDFSDEASPVSRGLSEAEKDLNRRIWESYRDAFLDRYGVAPIRNGRVNQNINSLRIRIGKDAVPVARFFLSIPDAFYLRTHHPVGTLLSQCESIRTQWLKGESLTASQARAMERDELNARAVSGAFEDFEFLTVKKHG